ncbi:MAG: hypothetical protein QXY62_03050 [Candidatus Altiarchaeota archaeon]
MKNIKIKSEALILIFIFSFLVIGIYHFFKSPYYKWLLMSPQLKCPIEYGKLVCLEGKPRILFFNPNDIDLVNISVVVPKPEGVDIYSVNEPLKANTTEVLTLLYHSCPFNVKTEELKVKWCCGQDCYETEMILPSNDLSVEIENNKR